MVEEALAARWPATGPGSQSGAVTATARVGDDQYPATAQCGMTASEIEAGAGEVTFVVADPGEFVEIVYGSDGSVPAGVEPPVMADLVILLE